MRELVHGDRRLKYPMKLVGGEWQRLSWDQAIDEIGDKLLAIRQTLGARFGVLAGLGQVHQRGRLPVPQVRAPSGAPTTSTTRRASATRTTVAGVANTWGYGAHDQQLQRHPQRQDHDRHGRQPGRSAPDRRCSTCWRGKELNRANFIVVDPRFTRTAAHATDYVRIRPGTDIPIIWGMLWHIFQNGWEDKEFIAQRVYGMDEIRARGRPSGRPQEVERVTGVPEAQLKRVAQIFATQKPATLIWCMGATQKTVGTANVRAFCILLHGDRQCRQRRHRLPTSSAAIPTCRAPPIWASISRPCRPTTGSTRRAWRHWCRVWEVDYDWMQSAASHSNEAAWRRRASPSTRWFDARGPAARPGGPARPTSRRCSSWGHGGNTVTRMPEAVKAMEQLELHGGLRPAPDDLFADLRPHATAPTCCRSARSFETVG